MQKTRKYILFSVIIVLGVVLDQITKLIATAKLYFPGEAIQYPRYSYWNDFFTFVYAENDGAFLSMGGNWDPTVRLIVLTIIPGLALVGFMVYMLRSNKLNLLENIAFALIAAGGIGNIIDRIMSGVVVDFMVMEAAGWHTGVFNVADLYIMFGIGFFLLSGIQKYQQEKKEKAEIDLSN